MDDPVDGLPEPQRSQYKALLLAKDVQIERERSKGWQKLAGRYDDIRDWLRICQDDSEGWQQFYKECCLLIFGEYRDSLPGVDDDECVLQMVGYHIQIPQELAQRRRTMGAYGMHPEPENQAQARRAVWATDLDVYAKRFHDSMRVMPQPSGTDFVGFDTWWVIVWAQIAGEDIESGRQYLEAEYHVGEVSLHYDPAMA